MHGVRPLRITSSAITSTLRPAEPRMSAQVGALIGVIARPQRGFFERRFIDDDPPGERHPTSGRKGGSHHGERRAAWIARSECRKLGGELRRRLTAQRRVDLLVQPLTRLPMGCLRRELASDGAGRGEARGCRHRPPARHAAPPIVVAPDHRRVAAELGERDGAVGSAGQVVGEDQPVGHSWLMPSLAAQRPVLRPRRAIRVGAERLAIQAVSSGTRMAVTTTEAATRSVALLAASA